MNVAMFRKPLEKCTKRELAALEKFGEAECDEWEAFLTLINKEIVRRGTKQTAKSKPKTV